MDLPHLSYRVPILNELKPGTVSLRVPVMDGAVQLSNPNTDAMERLSVAIETSEIRLAREDETPLQIEDVVIQPSTWHRRRVAVLVTPISELLVHPGEQKGVWSIANTKSLRVYNTRTMESFIGLIGVFAFRQQSKEQGREEAATAAKLLEMFDN